ncbi:hypothetical protein [Lishizhenia sp.]|uniref:hypothetical protein n=1 Tax=Lishizhenia sp. TaxID=2497594 RepID=UPI00299D78D3|nr:hypothetical protein [Lishizhenia sp.]MDX1447163.1 hypothetical protein [Lishizhenia sp.]
MEKDKNIFEQFKPSEKPSVPQGYFEQLHKELNHKIEPKAETRNKGYKIVLYSIASVAAVLLLFFSIIQPNTTTPTASVADITDLKTQEIGGYIEENIQHFDDELFVEAGYIAVASTSPQQNFETKISDLDIEDISAYLSEDDELSLEDF